MSWKNFLCTFLLLPFLTFSQEIQKLKLDDAINIALQKNVLINQTENSLELNKSQILLSYGNVLPTLNINSGFNWSRSEDEGGMFTLGNLTIPLPPTKSETRSYSASISSSLNLFDGLSSFYSIYQSKVNYDAAKYKLERLKQDIVFQTIVKYVNVLKAKKLMEVQEDNLKWNKKSLETIIERNKVGQVTLADVYQQQVNYGNAELLAIQSRNNYEILKNELLAFLGLDVALNYEVEDLNVEKLLNELKSEDLERTYTNFTELVKNALEYRPDYLAQKLQLLSNEYEISIARGGHFPKLSASISASTRSNRLSDLGKSRTYIAGLNLNIPIFNGWMISNRVQMAEVNYKNSKLTLDDLERNIKVNLKKSLLDLEASKKKLDVNNKNLLAAQENKRINEEKYNLGASTLLNLLIANSQYVQAQNDLINSSFDYLIIKKQIEYLIGNLKF
ncbi:MAG: TolC family protein [Ignavibacteria bacterium]|nr:TolC family protein [Ignavibacteria bacterium]